MTRGEFEVAVPSFFAVNVDFKAPEKGKPGPRCQLPVRVSDCHLESCLMGGQAFHWLATGTLQWSSAFGKYLITLYADVADNIEFSIHACDQCHGETSIQDYELMYDFLVDYLRLEIDLARLMDFWGAQDAHFNGLLRTRPAALRGIRVLRQDPFLTLLSFICSANNHIARISKLVLALTSNFGTFVCSISDRPFYSFPSLKTLLGVNKLEDKLKALSFGYRARYIAKTVQILGANSTGVQGAEAFKIARIYDDAMVCPVRALLYTYRDKPYEACLDLLMPLSGVGHKVADCICLFGLDKLECIPIDVHVWRISIRDYKIFKKSSGMLSGGRAAKTAVTPKMYDQVNAFYRELFKLFAGWAHSILFVADLDKFKKQVTP